MLLVKIIPSIRKSDFYSKKKIAKIKQSPFNRLFNIYCERTVIDIYYESTNINMCCKSKFYRYSDKPLTVHCWQEYMYFFYHVNIFSIGPDYQKKIRLSNRVGWNDLHVVKRILHGNGNSSVCFWHLHLGEKVGSASMSLLFYIFQSILNIYVISWKYFLFFPFTNLITILFYIE